MVSVNCMHSISILSMSVEAPDMYLMRTTESFEGGQATTLGSEAGFYQFFSGLLSVLSRTTQLFQELLFKL